MKKIKLKLNPLNELGKEEARKVMLKLLVRSSSLNPEFVKSIFMYLKDDAEVKYKVAIECYEELNKYYREDDIKNLLEKLKKEFNKNNP